MVLRLILGISLGISVVCLYAETQKDFQQEATQKESDNCCPEPSCLEKPTITVEELLLFAEQAEDELLEEDELSDKEVTEAVQAQKSEESHEPQSIYVPSTSPSASHKKRRHRFIRTLERAVGKTLEQLLAKEAEHLLRQMPKIAEKITAHLTRSGTALSLQPSPELACEYAQLLDHIAEHASSHCLQLKTDDVPLVRILLSHPAEERLKQLNAYLLVEDKDAVLLQELFLTSVMLLPPEIQKAIAPEVAQVRKEHQTLLDRFNT